MRPRNCNPDKNLRNGPGGTRTHGQRIKSRLIADLVAGRPARSHRSCRRVAAGGARAEYRNFFGRAPFDPVAITKGQLSQQIDQGIGGESGRRARPAHRWLDGGHSPYPRRRRDARRTGTARFPPMTQLTKPSGADDGVSYGSGCSCEKISILSAFRTCSHSSTSPARPQSFELT